MQVPMPTSIVSYVYMSFLNWNQIYSLEINCRSENTKFMLCVFNSPSTLLYKYRNPLKNYVQVQFEPMYCSTRQARLIVKAGGVCLPSPWVGKWGVGEGAEVTEGGSDKYLLGPLSKTSPCWRSLAIIAA